MHPGKAGSLLPQSPPHRICTVYRYPDLSLSDTRLPPGRSVAVSADLRLLPADRFRLLICISLPQIPDTAPPGQSGRSLLFCSGNSRSSIWYPCVFKKQAAFTSCSCPVFLLFKYSFPLIFCRKLNYVIMFCFQTFSSKISGSIHPGLQKVLDKCCSVDRRRTVLPNRFDMTFRSVSLMRCKSIFRHDLIILCH